MRLIATAPLLVFGLAVASRGECPVQLLSATPLQLGGPQAIHAAGDVAYVFGWDRTYSLDITDLAAPAIIAEAPNAPFKSAKALAQYQDWILVAGTDVRAYDTSDPANLDGPAIYADGETKYGIAVHGDRAFVTGDDGSHGTLTALDITNPLAPTLLGKSTTPQFGGYWPIDTLPSGLIAVGTITGYGHEVRLLDMQDPSNPILVSVALKGWHTSTTIGDLRIVGDRLFAGTETYSSLKVFLVDLKDAKSPFTTDSYDPGLIGIGRVGAGPAIAVAPNIKESHFLRVTADGKLELKHILPSEATSIPQIGVRGDFVFITHKSKLVIVSAGECRADCDCSRSLDIEDFMCFQTLFATSNYDADCDGDANLTIDDFICFQAAYSAGC